MKTLQDAIVVGGGPAGSSSAYELAKMGADVAVFEEHSKIGLPSHCPGHISIRSLRKLGLYSLPEGIVENTFSKANFYSPTGFKLSVKLTKPVTCVLNRELFDKFLAENAMKAGAEYFLNSRVQSLQIDGGRITGINAVVGDSTKRSFETKIVIDAEGISSRLLRQVGLQALNRRGLVYAAEAEAENILDIEDHAVEVYLGSHYAPGFYGWLIPRTDGSAKIGLATDNGNPKEYFEYLVRKHPIACKQLRAAKVKRTAFHALTLGGPIPRLYTNGFLAVGDCASQVKPTTGGGVVFGITCAKLAAEVAAGAFMKNDVSGKALKLYQERCNEVLGFDMWIMLRIRHLLNGLSDERLDKSMRFASRLGLEDSLKDIDEIDFQGRSMLSLLDKPAVYAALPYFLMLYFSANA